MEITLQTTYSVYMHTFKTTNKSYIGYTSLSISARLKRHYKNAYINNIDTHFYRAMRKYGISDIVSKCLFLTTSKKEALFKEKQLIAEYDTISNGYNMAQGGTGGQTLQKGTKKYDDWYNAKLAKVQGINNPRYSGYTDEQLVDEAVKLFVKNKKIYYRLWKEYAKENSLPQSFSKMRFDGKGWKQFSILLKQRLTKECIEYSDENFKYIKTEIHKSKIGKQSGAMLWYNDGESNTRVAPHKAKTLNLKQGKIKIHD